jgi:hypothetical protein
VFKYSAILMISALYVTSNCYTPLPHPFLFTYCISSFCVIHFIQC